MSRGMGAHRAGRRTHPRCPYQAYFPDLDSASTAAEQLGSHPARCRRCSGYHLTLPRSGGQR